MKTGIELITEERKRQIEKGYTTEKDSLYENGELISATQSYIEASSWDGERNFKRYDLDEFAWPWDEGFNPGNPVDSIMCLAKAGALIAAEIDRIQNIK